MWEPAPSRRTPNGFITQSHGIIPLNSFCIFNPDHRILPHCAGTGGLSGSVNNAAGVIIMRLSQRRGPDTREPGIQLRLESNGKSGEALRTDPLLRKRKRIRYGENS